MISATSLRAAPARSRHQPSGREPMTLLPSTKTLECAARVMPFYRSPLCRRGCPESERRPLPCQGAMILGAWARDTMAMRIPGGDCADGADCDCAGIRRRPRARIYGRLIGRCMAPGTSSSTYKTGVLPLDRGRYSGRERSGAPPPMLSMPSRMVASGIAPVGAVEASPFVVRHRTLPRASVRTAVQGGATLFIGAEDWTHVKPLTVDDGEGLRCSWGLDAVCSSRRDVRIGIT